MHRMHQVRDPLSIYTPYRPPFYPVQKLLSGAIRYQSGLAGCTGLNTCLHDASFGRLSSAPANQVWEPIAPDWPSCTGLNTPHVGYTYSTPPSTRCNSV
jgi:hypothetical protein